MPSKYKSKTKPIQNSTDQNNVRNYFKNKPIRPRCTNCGRESMVSDQYSKCYCGGTLQTYGVK